MQGNRARPGGYVACGLALSLFLGLQLGLLAGCSRPEPGVPATAASAPTNPPAPASGSAANSEAFAPASLAASAVLAAAAAAASAPLPTPTVAEAAPPAAALPPAIVAFQKQRDACDHLRGEDPYDKQRAAFLKAQLTKTCKGTDRALAALRKRFAQDPGALAALKDYENRIE